MSERHDRIAGYDVPIHRGVWERITTMGAPRIWGTLWLVGCLYAGLVVLVGCGVRWLPLVLIVWVVGQGVLVLLTNYEPYWDDLLWHMVFRWQRNRDFYEAGGRRDGSLR